MFSLSEATKFAHLPVAGGWYDQHPVLIDKWEYLLAKKSAWEREKSRKQEQQIKRQSRGKR